MTGKYIGKCDRKYIESVTENIGKCDRKYIDSVTENI